MHTIITTHKHTDFDALASVIAATLLYPESVGVIPKELSKNVQRFLSTHKTAFNLVLPNEVDFDQVEKLVVVDTASWRRLDRMEKLRDREDITIELWDHHDAGDITASYVVQENIGATVTLLIRELKKREIQLNPLTSTVMLIGLYEDTGHLTYPSTTPEDAYAAGYLLTHQADLNVAGFFLNPPYEERQKEILFEMMKETEKITINAFKIGFNIISLEGKTTTLSSIVSMYRSIINVDALFVIFITNDRATVIARSGVDHIDVGHIMSRIGGGGHLGAGSATLKIEDISPEEIKEKIISLIETEQHERIHIADIMSFPVFSVTPDTTMRKVHELMAKENIRGVLVMEDDTLLGIVVIWDFKKLKYEKHWKKPVKAYMTRDINTTTPDALPSQVAKMMLASDLGHLPVVHQGKVIGIVTRTDILNYFYDLLPE